MGQTVEQSKINYNFLILPHERNIGKIQDDLKKISSCNLVHIEQMIHLHKAQSVLNLSLCHVTAHNLSHQQTDLTTDKVEAIDNSTPRRVKYLTAGIYLGSGVLSLVGPAGQIVGNGLSKVVLDTCSAVATASQAGAKATETFGGTYDSTTQAIVQEKEGLTKTANDQQQSYVQSLNQAHQSIIAADQQNQKMHEAHAQTWISVGRMTGG